LHDRSVRQRLLRQRLHRDTADRAGQIAQELAPYGGANPSSLSCTNDGDCLQINLVSCAGGCGAPISRSAFSTAAETLAAIDQTYCVPFTAAGCKPAQAKCAAVLPRCVANSCELVPPP
jgi:hypothetical protein